MPRYTFKCHDCEREKKEIVESTVESMDCECGNFMFRQLPTTVNSSVMETLDPHRGKQVKKNLDRQLKERMNNHHDKYEVEQKIEQWGTNDATKHGWFKRRKN